MLEDYVTAYDVHPLALFFILTLDVGDKASPLLSSILTFKCIVT